jgi:predicted secreted Zn-dependent protease
MIASPLSMLAALLLAGAADEPAPPLTGIPGVTITSYDVAGRDAAAVRRAINAARPTDTNDGNRVDGLSRYDFRWRWHRDAGGRCSATPDDVAFTAVVTVPRLTGADPSSRLQAQFDRYLRSLLAHEDGHVRYAWDHRGDVVTAINAATCATANAAAIDALNAIKAHDIAYDQATRHGATTIVPFG